MITSFELLDGAECARAIDQIKALRTAWVARGGPSDSFFTLGAASYLDDASEYRERARRLNPILRAEFAWLHERLIDFLSKRLRAPVSLCDGLAVPGFHIWLTPAIFMKPEASVHFDLQFQRCWPSDAAGVDYQRPLSFTLPIRLPRRGGGLNVWDVEYARFRQFLASAQVKLEPKHLTVLLERLRHPYSLGAIALHSGYLLHQIGEIDAVFPGDERITLQGHALCQHGEWKLYW